MTKTLIPALALLSAGTLSAAAQRVTAVRYWSLAEVTRVVVEVTGDFEYRYERISNPDRLFFDISRAAPSIEGKRYYSLAVGDKLLDRVRVAETQPGVTRVVLDLAAHVEFTATRITNPNRLVVELRPAPAPPASEAQPAAPAAKPEPEVSTVAPAASPPAVALAKPAPAPPPSQPPKPAARMADGKSSMIRALGLKLNRVVIDPGHGGSDQGTVGRRGLMEKDLVLDVALRLGKLIEQGLGSEVIYTRTDDSFVPLEARTALANEKKADLFISIHANNSRLTRIAGAETFYLNFTTSRDALDVAARENASAQKSIHEFQDLLKKISLQSKIEESKELAGRVQAAMHSFSVKYNPGIRNRGVKKAPFVVLIGAEMPSVLVEIGFISNSREETLFKTSEHRQRAAEALYRGIERYAEGLSQFQVAATGKSGS